MILGSFKNNAPEFILRGHNRVLLGDYMGAILEFTKAIMIDPELPHPYTSRGAAKLELRDYEGAISDCLQAIKLHYKAELESKKNENRKKPLNINPIYGKLYSIIGTAKLLLGLKDEGILNLNSARLLGYNDAEDILRVYGK